MSSSELSGAKRAEAAQPPEIAARWRSVVERVEAAAQRSGRDPQDVTIVAVTKTHPPEVILPAVQAGATDLGENYVQELIAKRDRLEELGAGHVRWHFIGHLQRNKVKYLAPFCFLIHSVDRERLAAEIEKRAAAIGRQQPVLIEVNISGEQTKFGIAPENVIELARYVLKLEHVQLCGLMTMAPYSDDPETSRPIYRALRELRDRLVEEGIPPENMRHLSMGMTQDFEVAVEEGATIVRIGTAIFGPRRQ